MKIEKDTITFSSGRTAYANRGIVGINPNLSVHEGYDGSIPWPVPEWWGTEHPEWIDQNTLTSKDMVELADYMIDLWQKFKGTVK
jgi:hypothetical protein